MKELCRTCGRISEVVKLNEKCPFCNPIDMKDQDFEQSVVDWKEKLREDWLNIKLPKYATDRDICNWFIEQFESKLKLQREKDREDIFKYLENNYIKYCKEQNGMPYCKNCGLDLVEMENDLDKLNSKK